MSEFKVGDRVRIEGQIVRMDGRHVSVNLPSGEWWIPICACKKIETEKCGKLEEVTLECGFDKGHAGPHDFAVKPDPPKEPAPKPGDLRTTYDDPRYSHYADQVFRSGEGWIGLSRMPLSRRKPSTDSRHIALCALEALKPNDADSKLAIWNAARVIRVDLRADGSGGAGRNPHAAPRRKDDRS